MYMIVWAFSEKSYLRKNDDVVNNIASMLYVISLL